MKTQRHKRSGKLAAIILGLVAISGGMQIAFAAQFDSGSTCSIVPTPATCLGAFSPSVNTVVQLPSDGILDYSTFYIPIGVTVTFTKNANNTPVIIRTTGDVRIEGTISVSYATSPANVGTYGDGNLGDDGQPGTGGPGGFDGGFGGYSAMFGGAAGNPGGAGKGPGGGQAATGYDTNYYGDGRGFAGGGGSFGTSGNAGGAGYSSTPAGSTYGQVTILPLVGGSGGGGGSAGTSYSGAGGGGGGGGILIAAGTSSALATITVGTTANSTVGRIFADGGPGGNCSGSAVGGCGGGGSGGAIRLVANTLACPNSWCWMEALGGAAGSGSGGFSGGAGGAGRIRLESNVITGWNTGRTNPGYTTALPGHVLVPNNPTLVISSVTATTLPVTVPPNPTGNADVTFPQGTTTVTVNLAATNIPVGTTVTVYVVPASGALRTSALSNALSGSLASSTASATVTLSPGNNVLLASATYTVTEIIAFNLPTFDNGIRVAKIRVDATMDGKSTVTYITAMGKEYPADSPLRDKPKV